MIFARPIRITLPDPKVCKLASIEKQMLEHPGEVRFASYEKLSLIDDTIEELQDWASFNPEKEGDDDLDMFDLGSLLLTAQCLI